MFYKLNAYHVRKMLKTTSILLLQHLDGSDPFFIGFIMSMDLCYLCSKFNFLCQGPPRIIFPWQINLSFILSWNDCINISFLVSKAENTLYSRSRKKRNTHIYFNTNYRTEIKLVKIIILPTSIWWFKIFLRVASTWGGLNLTLIFSM